LVAAGRHATVRRPIAEKHLQLISPNSPLVNRQSCDLILFVSLPQMGCAAACTAADIQLTFDRRSAAQIARLDSGVNARGVGTSGHGSVSLEANIRPAGRHGLSAFRENAH
jgi:hypothetical protein